MASELRLCLEHAIAVDGAPSSDYDLNETRMAPDRKLRQAGVLIPIIDRIDDARVILTKRSSALKHHPGQISFPGGKVEEGDNTIVAAALREAKEEIGLSPEKPEVLGVLPSHETVTSFDITPVIAIVPEFTPVPEAGEVEEVFDVPLVHLMNPANYCVEHRMWRGKPRYYFTVPWGPYYIWGATARILRALAERMHDTDYSRLA